MSRHVHDLLEGLGILLADGCNAARPVGVRALTMAAQAALAGSGLCFRAFCRLAAAAVALSDQHGGQPKAPASSYHAAEGVIGGGFRG